MPRMELPTCSVSSEHNRQQNRSRALRHYWGQKVLKRAHILHIQFAFEMELISLFYKMYYNIRPGLGLQCVIVVFPDHTHLFFLVFNMHSRKRIKMHYGRHRKCRKDGVFFLCFLFLFKYMLVNSYLICDSSNSMI